jgi:hypothetical protein
MAKETGYFWVVMSSIAISYVAGYVLGHAQGIDDSVTQ